MTDQSWGYRTLRTLMRLSVVTVAGSATLALSLLSAAAATASGWTIQPTPNPAGAQSTFLSSVSCPSRTVCIAVGGSTTRGRGTLLAERWNGAKWALQSTPKPANRMSASFSSVACPSANVCIAVGSFTARTATATTLAARWNGRAWTIQRTRNPAHATAAYLRGVSCPSPRFCIAVGYFDTLGHPGVTLAERWNGTDWAIQRLPSSAFGSTLAGVSCSSRVSCVAVGGIGPVFGPEMPLALRWNGAGWAAQRLPRAPALSLLSVSCAARPACTAVGRPATLAKRWNGTTWTSQRPPKPPGAQDSQLNSDSCAGGTTCIAVGSYLTGRTGRMVPLADRWSTGRWSIQAAAQPAGAKSAGLNGVSCPSLSVCIAVGSAHSAAGADVTLAERYSP